MTRQVFDQVTEVRPNSLPFFQKVIQEQGHRIRRTPGEQEYDQPGGNKRQSSQKIPVELVQAVVNNLHRFLDI
jgi:hypothetical protein